MLNKVSLPDGLGLRTAGPGDKPFIEKLFQSTREFLYLADAEKEYVDMIIHHQMQLQEDAYGNQSPNACTMIVEKQSTPIGKVIIDFGSNIAHVIDLAFIAEARGKGYGKAVLRAVQYVATQQMLPVGLTVDKQNLPAKQLYLTLGFQIAEESLTHEFMLWYPSANQATV